MSHGPLSGTTVVELASIGPGPFACGMLADLGATVVRIDRPGGAGRGLPGGAGRIGVRDRVVVELDLKTREGLDRARTIVGSADVLVEGFRPGVAERLGLGPEPMMEANPRLVYLRLTGWGQSGPYADTAGHDINYVAVAGVLGAIGTDRPTPPLNLVGDYGGGAMFGVVGVLAALLDRARTDVGQVIDAAMVDGAGVLLGPIRELVNLGLWREERSSNLLDGGAPFYRTYETADGRHVAVGALEDEFYAALLEGLGLADDEVPDRRDPSAWDALTTVLAGRFATRTRDEWAGVFRGTDACVSPVLTMSEVSDDPHMRARGALVETPAGPIPAPAPRFSGGAGFPGQASVSDTLVALGLSAEDVGRLCDTGAAYSV